MPRDLDGGTGEDHDLARGPDVIEHKSVNAAAGGTGLLPGGVMRLAVLVGRAVCDGAGQRYRTLG